MVGDGQKPAMDSWGSQAKLRPTKPAQSGVTLHPNATIVKLNKGRKISIVYARLKKCGAFLFLAVPGARLPPRAARRVRPRPVDARLQVTRVSNGRRGGSGRSRERAGTWGGSREPTRARRGDNRHMQQKVGRVRCLLLRQPSHPLQRRATKFECGSCGAISTGVGDGDLEGGHVTQRRFFGAGGETTGRRPPAGVTVPVGCGALDAPAGCTGWRCVGGENFLKRLWPLKAPRGDPSDRRGTGDSSQPKMQCPVVDTGDGRGLSMLPLRFGARPMAGGGGGSFVFSLMAMAEGLGATAATGGAEEAAAPPPQSPELAIGRVGGKTAAGRRRHQGSRREAAQQAAHHDSPPRRI